VVSREEFPDLDLTVNGAVSIGRRLMDPLAEVVQIGTQNLLELVITSRCDQNAFEKLLLMDYRIGLP